MAKPKICRQGQCPNCGSNDLEYGGLDLGAGNEVFYPVHCLKCGWIGEKWYKMKYIGYRIKGRKNRKKYKG